MENLKKTFCRYDMVCDNPSGVGVEICHMPSYFDVKPAMETSHMHVHGFYEIIWFQEGEGLHYVDFCEYPVTPGAVFFIAPGQVHSFDKLHNQKGVVLKVCSDFFNCSLDSGDAYLLYNVFNVLDEVPYCKVTDNETRTLSNIIESIEEELLQNGAIGHKDYLQSLIKMFIICVQRNTSADKVIMNPARTSHRMFLEFRRLIEDNYREMQKVKDYASKLNTTSKTLTQYVNECSLYSPLELINNRIILEAKRLLCYSNKTVKEIAFTLGFEDPSYFVKFFKRETKKSPADYREEAI